MAVSLLGLPTWMTIQLDPDGVGGPIGPRVGVGLVSVGLVGTGSGLLLTPGGSDVLGVVLSLVGLATAAAFAVIRRPRWLLASHLLLRMWLVVSVAGLYTRRRHDDVALIWLTVLVFAIVIAGEPILRRGLNVQRVFVANLPGVPSRRSTIAPISVIPLSSVVGALVGLILAATTGSAVIWLVLALVAAALAGAVALSAGRQLLQDRNRKRAVARAVRAFAPEFAIYTSRPDDASYQVTMWLPYLERVGRPFVIITRDRLPADVLSGLTDVPVICARSSGELEAMLVPSLTTVFYVNASSGNGQMVRHSHLTHIYLGHGDSDKAPSYNPTHAMYDMVFAAGEAAIDRYPAHDVHIPRERFAVVGRPQVESITPAERPIGQIADQTVLYAPTWRGHVDETALYSVPQGEAIVAALVEHGARVIFRPHPFTYASAEDAAFVRRIHALLAADTAQTGRQHVYGAAAETELSIIDCFNLSDAMFSDVSSVVSDYLHSGKPFAIYVAGDSAAEFVEAFPTARAGYLLAGDLHDLADVVRDTLEDDPQRDGRLALATYYLGDFPAQTYAEAFVAEADRLIAGIGIHRGERLEDSSDDDDVDGGGGDRDSAGIGGGTADDEDGAVATTRGGRQVSARHALIVSAGYAALDATSAVTAAAATFCALDGLATTLSVVFAALSLLWMCVARPPWRQRSKVGLLGAFAVQRVLLFVAVASITLRDPRVSDLGTTVLLALLGFGPLLEMWIREVLQIRRLRVLNLPTLPYSPVSWAIHSQVYTASLVLVVAELALAPAGRIAWMLALAVVMLVALVAMLVRDLQLRAGSVRAKDQLQEALTAYDAQFAVYFAASPDSAYQMAMWMPYFERLDRRFIVVTRTASTLLPLSQLTDAPIVLCRTLASLEETMSPRLSTVFYVNNGLKNTHYIERRQLTHIWLNHGDSEKPACFNPVHAIYDRIFTAGQAGIDRYARHGVNIAPEKFEVVGRPQVEAIEIAHALPAPEAGPPTVLYAPTWIGPFADSNVYSLPVGRGIVEGLIARGCRVVFRAHPLNYAAPVAVQLMREIGELLEADRAATGREHLWGPAAEQDLSFEDCANVSDAMIADVSAVVSDYLFSEKPFAIVAMGGSSEQLVATAPVAAAAYVVSGDLANLGEVLDELLVTDPLRAERVQTKEYYLGASPAGGEYAEGFLRAARRHVDCPPHGSGQLTTH